MPNNYCLGEVECALGAKLIDRIDAINADKRDRALRFIDAIGEDTPLKFHRVDSTRHTYHLLAAEFQNDQRDAFIEHMYSQKGVQTIVQYYPLYRYDFYKKLGMGEANCPNTDRFFDNMISFPFHHCLSDEDFGYMLSATKSVIQELCTSYTS